VEEDFVQDNHSRSPRGIVRGMHFQVGEGLAKLVRCPRGAVFDVVVDLRRGSPTFGEWEGFELNEDNLHQVYCPIGFAHGFCVLSEVADVVYKQSAYFDPELEWAFAFADPEVAIGWPKGLHLSASEKDANAPPLSQIADDLPFEFDRRD
jgi:dTDP-4-dehydrorhamnose 3,5-epimerase